MHSVRVHYSTLINVGATWPFYVCRLPTADFLLSGGQSMTWLLGNKLITVTTSGCSMKALKNGLCDKCRMLCRADKGENMQIDTIDFVLYKCINCGKPENNA